MKLTKHNRKLCLQCQNHRALVRFRGRVYRDAEHTLCFRCFRSLTDAWYAERLAGLGL